MQILNATDNTHIKLHSARQRTVKTVYLLEQIDSSYKVIAVRNCHTYNDVPLNLIQLCEEFPNLSHYAVDNVIRNSAVLDEYINKITNETTMI